MNKLINKIILFTTIILISACNTPVNNSTKTHVKDLAESDLFGVLPEYDLEVVVYNKPDEIEGEYLELAKVEIEETSEANTMTDVLERLKTEAKNLGGNGILLTESKVSEKGEMKTLTIKAIAVYALERIPGESPIVAL